MKVLVTGCAGFIGMFTALKLLERGDTVVGVDNLNDYYDVGLKHDRLKQLANRTHFRFVKLDLADSAATATLFADEAFDAVVHLAAQAGVRYSLEQPHAYVSSNLVGFTNVLEGCRHGKIGHLVYASSSSVYGGNQKVPFAETDPVDHPVSFYAATKVANEAMAHSYSHLFRLPATGLRFFTVYGPWGRPDMSPMLFARAIMDGTPIRVFNHGDMQRDFTYVDDIVEGVVRVLDQPAAANPAWNALQPDAASSNAPWRIYNIGNHQPVNLLDYIDTLEEVLGRATQRVMLPMQDGDVKVTCADTSRLHAATGFVPATPLRAGLERFAGWFREYYGY